ncbi:MAG: 50S ribosomal protein L24 [Dehalococcoidia bacterium]|jgi:large subunit ribosomal protein L24|nr:MAG: 50S ribosomal protein L24 [Dehalococcoidia bacterium]
MRIRKNDNVLVIKGKDRGKTGKVRFAYPEKKTLLVEGVNMIKKHARARGNVRQAGIIAREAPLPAANVMLLCSRCNKPARIGFRFFDDGRKVRFCRACGEVID